MIFSARFRRTRIQLQQAVSALAHAKLDRRAQHAERFRRRVSCCVLIFRPPGSFAPIGGKRDTNHLQPAHWLAPHTMLQRLMCHPHQRYTMTNDLHPGWGTLFASTLPTMTPSRAADAQGSTPSTSRPAIVSCSASSCRIDIRIQPHSRNHCSEIFTAAALMTNCCKEAADRYRKNRRKSSTP